MTTLSTTLIQEIARLAPRVRAFLDGPRDQRKEMGLQEIELVKSGEVDVVKPDAMPDGVERST